MSKGVITMFDTRFLATLVEMLHDRGSDAIFPCIQDLVENALVLSRFSAGDPAPNRQDITQYLAAWCRHVGLTEDACRSWLTEYCVAMLAPISKSSEAGIRHSTKSNVRYIYRSGMAFVCGRETNRFRAHCRRDCPAYAGVQANPSNMQQSELSTIHNESQVKTALLPVSPVKVIYRDQFQAALRLVHQEIMKGAKKKAILGLLHERGLKTRTGRQWTYRTLCVEIGKLEATHASPCNPQQGHASARNADVEPEEGAGGELRARA
jgi:hypothetical protein